ncbi:MAG: murein hydrolase activator EnvC family protein [Pseudomonadota bacterium]
MAAPARLLLIAAVAALGVAVAQAESGDRQATERQLEAVRGKIQSLMDEMAHVRQQKSEAEQALYATERRLGKVRSELSRLERQIDENKSRLNKLENRRGNLQEQLQAQKKRLAQQLKAHYISGQREQLKLLLNQEDPAALSRITTYYDYLNRARQERIQAARDTLEELRSVSREIESENRKLGALAVEHDEQRQLLAGQRKQRETALDRVRDELASEGRQLARLREDEQRFESLLESLSNLLADIPDAPSADVPFTSLRGQLPWPTDGKVIHQFGQKRSPGGLDWQGLVVKAPAGRKVRSIYSGRVAFADYFQGFGLIVIIDHNNGYLSLYGHNRLLYVGTGDWVKRDEVISEVGDSGGRSDSALYFELRHRGQPVDPGQWLARR